MQRPGVHRQSNTSRRILDKLASYTDGRNRTRFHVRPGMRDARGGPEHDRDIELLRKLKAIDRHIFCFLWVAGVQAGNRCKLGVAS